MNALEIRDLCKSYPGFSLQNLTLTLPQGCIMGLIGENGAGKSTTIRLILEMAQKDSGSIRILGKDNTENISLTKEDVGVVLDEVGFPECLTAQQVGNIMKNTYRNWNPDVYKKYMKELALPENKEFKEFSRGMKMKLGIAVALSHDPKLLILDEATSGLDPATSMEIHKMLLELKDAGMAIFLTTHNMEEAAKLCDNVALLNEGIIVEYGNPKDICLRHNIHKRYRVRLHDGSIHELAQSEESARAIANWLAQDQIETIHSCEPTLETVFLSATGRPLS